MSDLFTVRTMPKSTKEQVWFDLQQDGYHCRIWKNDDGVWFFDMREAGNCVSIERINLSEIMTENKNGETPTLEMLEDK